VQARTTGRIKKLITEFNKNLIQTFRNKLSIHDESNQVEEGETQTS